MGACGRVWRHVAEVMAGCGGMSQGLGICGRVSCPWHGWGHMVGVGTCGRVWGHVTGVVAWCEGMWQGWGHVAGCQAYGIDGDML